MTEGVTEGKNGAAGDGGGVGVDVGCVWVVEGGGVTLLVVVDVVVVDVVVVDAVVVDVVTVVVVKVVLV